MKDVVTLCILLTAGCVGTIGQGASTGSSGGIDPGDPGNPVDPGNPDPSPSPIGDLPPSLPGFDPAFACGTDSAVTSEMRRLPKVQYVNSLREFLSTLGAANVDKLLGLASVQSALRLIPDDGVDARTELILRNIHDNRLGADHVNGVFEVGATLAEQLAGSDAYLNELVKVCGAGATRASLAQATCLNTFVTHYARKALRRPATAAELTDFKAAYAQDGLDSFLGRLLVLPRFYYRVDVDGQQLSGTEGTDATYKLGKYELLSKMTFLFSNAPPGDDLYQLAAGAADLPVDEVLDQLFASGGAAKAGIRAFFNDWLHLEKAPPLKSVTDAAFKTLAAGESLGGAVQAMTDEVLDMAEHYTWKDQGRYDDLLTSPYSFARTPDLAHIYQVPTWDGTQGNLVPSTGTAPRAGLLTRAVLLETSGVITRPILKGLAIRRNVLCDTLPSPPPAVDGKPISSFLTPENTRTTRADIEDALSKSPVCAGCHDFFTPLGFATESYDSLGRYRSEELKFNADGSVANRIPVDTQVTPALFDGDEAVVNDAIELGDHIAKSGKGHNCLVRQYFRYATAREESEETDGCGLESMRLRLMESGGGLMTMFKETVRSKAFQQRKIQ